MKKPKTKNGDAQKKRSGCEVRGVSPEASIGCAVRCEQRCDSPERGSGIANCGVKLRVTAVFFKNL